jgi:hypothetical protein
MRVNLIAQSAAPVATGTATIPVTLTIRPACGLPGDFIFPTDSSSLLSMLRKKTDLSLSALDRFKRDLYVSPRARLLGVELSDPFLTEIGYFID